MKRALTGSNTTDTLDAINTEISPKLTAHGDAITLDPVLFARVKAVYDARETLGLEGEDLTLLENTYDNMVHAGALPSDAEREQVKAINTELSTLTTEFGQLARNAMSDQRRKASVSSRRTTSHIAVNISAPSPTTG